MTIEDQDRRGWALVACRAARAKQVGIVEAATVPLVVIGADWSNSKVAE